jgi:hypothetical protein
MMNSVLTENFFSQNKTPRYLKESISLDSKLILSNNHQGTNLSQEIKEWKAIIIFRKQGTRRQYRISKKQRVIERKETIQQRKTEAWKQFQQFWKNRGITLLNYNKSTITILD